MINMQVVRLKEFKLVSSAQNIDINPCLQDHVTFVDKSDAIIKSDRYFPLFQLHSDTFLLKFSCPLNILNFNANLPLKLLQVG